MSKGMHFKNVNEKNQRYPSQPYVFVTFLYVSNTCDKTLDNSYCYCRICFECILQPGKEHATLAIECTKPTRSSCRSPSSPQPWINCNKCSCRRFVSWYVGTCFVTHISPTLRIKGMASDCPRPEVRHGNRETILTS